VVGPGVPVRSRDDGRPEEELRFLQEFAQQVAPAIYNVYLMRRLRERAGALERARFARELHDGAIQSLIAVEMQLDVLRRQSGTQAPVVNTELGRIQKLLREEVLKLRELMQAMKSFEVDADRLLGFISDTVERFRRETGNRRRVRQRTGAGGSGAKGMPGTGAHRAGEPGQRAQAQWSAPCAGTVGAAGR
jgi:signal transduction histidine kinase